MFDGMSPPSALKLVSAPISNLKPRSLIVSGAGVIPLGFVAQGNGTVVVKWASPLDPSNPNESLPVINGAQYPGHIDTIVSSDVDLLFYFGDENAGAVHLGGGVSTGGATLAEQEAQTLLLTTIAAAADIPLSNVVTAVDTLAGGATIAQIVSALSSDATTQDNILTKLTTIDSTLSGKLDVPISDLKTQLVAIAASAASIDGKSTTIASNTGTTSTNTTAIASSVDQLEGYLDGVEGKLDTGNASASTTATNTGTTATNTGTIAGAVASSEGRAVSIGAAVSATVKSGAGKVFALFLKNVSASTTLYVWVWDAASATGTPIFPPFTLSAGQERGIGVDMLTADGHAFSIGLTWGFSTSTSTYSAHSTSADCQATVLYT